MGTMHKASMNSERMQKLLTYLESRAFVGCTPMEIIHACGTTNAARDVSELRANGYPVVCIEQGMTENGRRLSRYWLEKYAPNQQTEMFAKPVWGVER